MKNLLNSKIEKNLRLIFIFFITLVISLIILVTYLISEQKNTDEEINKLLAEKGIFLSHLVNKKVSLEEQFLKLTNK